MYLAKGTRVMATYRKWNVTTRKWERLTEPGAIATYVNKPDGFEKVAFDNGDTLNLPAHSIVIDNGPAR